MSQSKLGVVLCIVLALAMASAYLAVVWPKDTNQAVDPAREACRASAPEECVPSSATGSSLHCWCAHRATGEQFEYYLRGEGDRP